MKQLCLFTNGRKRFSTVDWEESKKRIAKETS